MDTNQLTRFEKRRLRTRKKLQDAAIQLIIEKGYDAVTIQEITDLADLARATFYVHYKDKDELIWEVANQQAVDFMGHALENYGQDDSGHPLLFHALYLDFQLIEKNKDLYRVIFGSSGFGAIREQMVGLIAGDIQRAVEEDLFFSEKVDSPELFAQFLTGAIAQLIAWWLETPNDLSAQDMAECMITFIQTGYSLK